MGELSQYLVEQILLGESTINKVIVVYSGRFQPMHKGHFGVYAHLIKKFGKDNVFIATSDKVDLPNSPLNFSEKKLVMTTMFGVPSDKIVQVKNPYIPTEILSKYDEATTAYITVVSEKDEMRLGGKYFSKWDGNPEDGYKDKGYVYISPMFGEGISATEIRKMLSSGSDESKQSYFKIKFMGNLIKKYLIYWFLNFQP